MTIIKRRDLGRPLTWDELDANFEEVDSLVSQATIAVNAATNQANASQQSAETAQQSAISAENAYQNNVNSLSRVLRVPQGETITELPPVAQRLSKIFTTDNTGAVTLLDTIDASQLTIGATRFYDFALKDVKFYGAVGDGVEDDTQAFKDAIAANGGQIYCSPGNYVISDTIDFSGAVDVTIRGQGRGSTSITYIGTSTLFSGVFTNSIRSVEVSDIRILTTKLNVAVGFYFEWPEDFEHGFVQRGSFFNVSVRGVDEYEQGWQTCVHLHQGDNINFINCEFKGAGGSTTVTQAYNTRCDNLIRISGRFSPVEYRFIGCYFGSAKYFIKIEDTAEGIYVSNCIGICGLYGIHWGTGTWSPNWPGTPNANASGRPLLIVDHSHFNVYQQAIHTEGVVSIHYDNLLLYHNDNAIQNGKLISIENATDIFINNIEGWGFNTSFYADVISLVGNVTYGRFSNISGITASTSSLRYVVDVASNCSKNDFSNVNRRTTGGTFVNNTLINDASNGLNNIGIKGAQYFRTSNQNFNSGVPAKVNWEGRDYDSFTMWSGIGGDITIPDGVSRVRVTASVLFNTAATSSYREIVLLKNNSSTRASGAQSVTAVQGKGTYLNIASGTISVQKGDVLSLQARHDDGVDLVIVGTLCWLQVEILQ